MPKHRKHTAKKRKFVPIQQSEQDILEQQIRAVKETLEIDHLTKYFAQNKLIRKNFKNLKRAQKKSLTTFLEESQKIHDKVRDANYSYNTSVSDIGLKKVAFTLLFILFLLLIMIPIIFLAIVMSSTPLALVIASGIVAAGILFLVGEPLKNLFTLLVTQLHAKYNMDKLITNTLNELNLGNELSNEEPPITNSYFSLSKLFCCTPKELATINESDVELENIKYHQTQQNESSDSELSEQEELAAINESDIDVEELEDHQTQQNKSDSDYELEEREEELDKSDEDEPSFESLADDFRLTVTT